MTDEVELIDLNQADAEKLTALPGIGMSLAKRIVEFRETVHPFEEVIELAAVPGISERTVRKFEDRLMVAAPETMEAEARTAAVELVETSPLEAEGETETVSDISGEVEALPDSQPEPPVETTGGSDVGAPSAGDSEVPDTEEVLAAPDQFAELDFAAPPPRPAATDLDQASQYRPVVADEVDAPAAPAGDQEKKAQRRGCFALVAGAVLGSVIGAILSLAIIAQLNNGTLSFYQADVQLQGELSSARLAQGDMDARLGLLDTQATDLATRTMKMAEQQDAADATLVELQQTIADIEREVAALETVTEELDNRLISVAAAAETFNTFLSGLRDLLFEVQGPPPTPEPTATPIDMATPAEATVEPEPSADEIPEATPTSVGLPTRTPRPTATPFDSLPTSTPEPQP